MTIPLQFLTRYAIPLIVAALYLGDVDIPQQMDIFDKTERLADEALSNARKEGEGTETYDYIIVGAGSAGALLANRLTASGENRVLLLEAGGDPNPVFEVPYAQRFFWGSDINNWRYFTEKQDKACGRMGGICPWPRGKTLGGSSSINGLVYNRCKPKDYDLWANFTGDQSWSWQNVKDTYNSFEDYHGFYEDTAGDRHGYEGEMYVGKIDYIPGVEVFEEALAEKGFPVGDHNGGEDFTYGFGKIDYNIKDGLRWGTYQAFLLPILNRTNLVLYRHAVASKILTNEVGGTHRAVGITYERHGITRTAMANKEVLLAAGVIESPKLLMLSGIGPREHLEELGIQTIVDLPAVGQHLQDHPGMEIKGTNGGFVVNTTFARDHNTTENVLQFIHNGTGPLNAFQYESGYAAQIMTGYITSSYNDDRAWPEIHIYVDQQYFPDVDRQEFFFALELVRTDTEGFVKLASSDFREKPIIDPNVFGDPTDIERLVDGIETMMDIYLNTTTFQKYGIQDMGPQTTCNSHEYRSRDYWRCVVQDQGQSYMHPTSTCRMGPDRNVAVVDSKLKVFNVEQLRVIDASSIPFVPSGNTNLPAMLIGARGAELILSGQ